MNGIADAIGTFNRRDFQLALDRFDIALWTPSDALRRLRP